MKTPRLHVGPGFASSLALLAVLALTHCGACEQSPGETLRSSGRGHESTGSSLGQELKPIESEVGFSGVEKLPEGFEFGPANIQTRQFAGEMDLKNHYGRAR